MPAAAPSSSSLSELVKILSENAQTLESAYANVGGYPDLAAPFAPNPLDQDPKVDGAARAVVAAAYQIIASVRAPFETMVEQAMGAYMTASLNLVVERNVANVLAEAGAKGAHVNAISKETGVAPDRLARILRFLATRHIFKEVEPDVFAHNRVSSLMTKPHSREEFKAKPEIEYDGAPVASLVAHVTDECFQSSLSMPAWIKDNTNKHAAPFNMAMGTPLSVFEWFALPENAHRFRRWVTAMTGGGERYPPSVFTGGFDWKSLKKDELVVDVGGSVGSVVYTLIQEFPHLRYVVQDLESVIVGDAKQYWEGKMPTALAQGRVQLQATNFFESQPVKNAAVYFMRLVLHDWPDYKCKTILKHVRGAAAPSSKLIVFESIMQYACAFNGPFADVSNPFHAPAPLLANLGMGGSGFLTGLDLQMLNLFNGKERTVLEFIELGKETGWELEAVKPGPMMALVFKAV